jgi:hypothetical protein
MEWLEVVTGCETKNRYYIYPGKINLEYSNIKKLKSKLIQMELKQVVLLFLKPKRNQLAVKDFVVRKKS